MSTQHGAKPDGSVGVQGSTILVELSDDGHSSSGACRAGVLSEEISNSSNTDDLRRVYWRILEINSIFFSDFFERM